MSLAERFADQLDQVDELMRSELRQWPLAATGRLGESVTGQVALAGLRLRPITALCFAELYGARFNRAERGGLDGVVAPAAAVEFSHRAVLADDAPATAGMLRSLSYHPIHRSALLDETEKLALHRELDDAATLLALGQSIDAGWREGGYPSYLDYPYEQLLAWKTGSLFGCAAAMGARVAGAPGNAVEDAREQGVALGALHQFAHDYLDVFAADGPSYEDYRAGRLRGPVVHLLRALHTAGRDRAAESVVRRLADEARSAGDVGWLLALMRTCNVEQAMRAELSARAAPLDASGLEDLVRLALGGYPWR